MSNATGDERLSNKLIACGAIKLEETPYGFCDWYEVPANERDDDMVKLLLLPRLGEVGSIGLPASDRKKFKVAKHAKVIAFVQECKMVLSSELVANGGWGEFPPDEWY